MKWRDKVTDAELLTGELRITGDAYKNQKLSSTDISEIVNAVKDGFVDRERCSAYH